MASSSIISWQIEGEKVEVVTDFFFLALKSLRMVTVSMKSEDDCFLSCIQVSQEIGKAVWYSNHFKNVPGFAVRESIPRQVDRKSVV